jgi:hypothetical protein
MGEEFEGLRNALLAIRQSHVPDQPASSGADEVSWVMQHVGRLRKIAADALDATKATTQSQLRLCGFCRAWYSKPCGEGCQWLPTDPVFEAKPDAR